MIDELKIDGWVIWWTNHWFIGGDGWRQWRNRWKIINIEFAFMAIEVYRKISLQVFHGYATSWLLYKTSIFSCFQASDFSQNNKCTDEVVELGHISPSSLPPLPCTCYSTPLSLCHSPSVSKQFTSQLSLFNDMHNLPCLLH
jgi:hypothetical protein